MMGAFRRWDMDRHERRVQDEPPPWARRCRRLPSTPREKSDRPVGQDGPTRTPSPSMADVTHPSRPSRPDYTQGDDPISHRLQAERAAEAHGRPFAEIAKEEWQMETVELIDGRRQGSHRRGRRRRRSKKATAPRWTHWHRQEGPREVIAPTDGTRFLVPVSSPPAMNTRRASLLSGLALRVFCPSTVDFAFPAQRRRLAHAGHSGKRSEGHGRYQVAKPAPH